MNHLSLEGDLGEGVQQCEVQHRCIAVQRNPLKELHALQPEEDGVWIRCGLSVKSGKSECMQKGVCGKCCEG